MNELHGEDFRPWVVAIGASGGAGLRDIVQLLSSLSPRVEAVVMVVLHRPFAAPTKLREILSRATPMPVVVAEHGERLMPGCCYIGEPATHLTLASRSFGFVIEDPHQLHRNRTIDLLFKSLAKHSGARTIGVVLSGLLDDGARGLAAIHGAGGQTMVIVPDRHGEDGMPESAIGYDGPIDCIGPVPEIAAAIRTLVGSSEPSPSALSA